MSKYTEGPWRLIDARLTGANSTFVCLLEGMDIKNREECEANANLITSAPELYEACREWSILWRIIKEDYPDIKLSSMVYDGHDAVDRLYIAIAKAEGGSHG